MKPDFTTVYHFFPDIEQTRVREAFVDLQDPFFWEVFEACKAYTLISVERFYNLFRSIEYLARRDVPGDFVECGVFLGGAAMGMALFGDHFGIGDRRIHLYDTFTGFGEGIHEVNLAGVEETLPPLPDFEDVVASNLEKLGLDRERFVFVKGPVEETLLETVPDPIGLLRLDTDYYESTLVELCRLHPRLSRGGVLIIDDYGHYDGARRATDEYFRTLDETMLLHRIDYSCRCGIRT